MDESILKQKILANSELVNNLKEIKFQGKVGDFIELFNNYFDNYYQCTKEPNLDLCQQKFKGYKYYFLCQNNILFLTTICCEHSLAIKNELKIPNNYIYTDFTNDYFKICFTKNDNGESSKKEIMIEIKKFIIGKRKTGLYISGNPGIGKTYLLIQTANKLASLGKKIAFVSMENLLGKLKDSFSNINDSNISLITKILTAEIIFLDDIGAGLNSAWVRDEVLFRLINGALLKKIPMFFSSNFSLDNLAKELQSIKGENNAISIIKTRRIVDRIKGLSKEMVLTGESYRKSE